MDIITLAIVKKYIDSRVSESIDDCLEPINEILATLVTPPELDTIVNTLSTLTTPDLEGGDIE